MKHRLRDLFVLLVACSALGQARDVFIGPGSSIEDAIQKAGPGGRVLLLAGQYLIQRPIQIAFPITITSDPRQAPGSVQIRGGNANLPIFISNGVNDISITGLYFVPVTGVAGADHRGQGAFVWQAIRGSDLTFRNNRAYKFRSGLQAVNCNQVTNSDNVISGGQ